MYTIQSNMFLNNVVINLRKNRVIKIYLPSGLWLLSSSSNNSSGWRGPYSIEYKGNPMFFFFFDSAIANENKTQWISDQLSRCTSYILRLLRNPRHVLIY